MATLGEKVSVEEFHTSVQGLATKGDIKVVVDRLQAVEKRLGAIENNMATKTDIGLMAAALIAILETGPAREMQGAGTLSEEIRKSFGLEEWGRRATALCVSLIRTDPHPLGRYVR